MRISSLNAGIEHQVGLRPAAPRRADADVQRTIGEFVGGAFFEPVLKSMQNSPFKNRYSGDSRALNAFNGQLSLELCKSLGRAGMHGFGKRLYEAVERRIQSDLGSSRVKESP